MEKNLKCLRCGEPMKYVGTENFQLGRTHYLLGDLPNLLAGAMKLSIYHCSVCGKVEFFSFEPFDEDESEDQIAKVACPRCKQMHDMDYPKCPHCGHDYR